MTTPNMVCVFMTVIGFTTSLSRRSLHVLSKGRLFMGIGAAWNQEESSAYGIPFPSIKERFVRLEEAIQIIRKMWTDEPSTSFNDKYYQIKNAYCKE
ncbi:MAG: LLM class flavin-dependent oxidoreductase [Candidatus Nitrosopolaris sp.]